MMNVSDVKMTRFEILDRVDLIKFKSDLKMKSRLQAEELTGMISLLRRNSIFDGLRSSLSRRECQ